ncbi:MAG: ribonuclease HI family protein [Euryarchaeota archaeon]|nr:ribonuclease HI family protein [Euryarchaeota archaeon]
MLKIYTDGASRGNPGPAAWAYIIFEDKKIQEENSGYLGEATNNTVEYNAIINALKRAKGYNEKEIQVYSDSELAIKQINREYKTNKPHLRKLRDKIYSLSQKFRNIEFAHVPRENKYIQRCDALCNRSLDGRGF